AADGCCVGWSGGHRSTLAQDNRRQNALLRAGVRLLRFTAADVLNAPQEVVRIVGAELGIIPSFGGHGGGETPVPFPNTEVKPSSADGTVGVTRWESRSLPSVLISPAARKGGGT